MMPLAFDLISTFVIGSILPVATTDLHHRAALDRRELRGIDVGRRALERGEAGRAADDEQPTAAPMYSVSVRFSGWTSYRTLTRSGGAKFKTRRMRLRYCAMWILQSAGLEPTIVHVSPAARRRQDRRAARRAPTSSWMPRWSRACTAG